ncbi:unnamed protein product [Notodromas monacha]|uniref:Nuclear receptor coactivator 6 TRADD-N domain-containing protein n=1 Tax=Notodromas monacha TaxID=399045 RepID=A0A7R9BCG5_9CRUS|nr:unnamed protein product [Notodromas monacha]CAG0912761.1 unnamed protein product [Notodromas monacha]
MTSDDADDLLEAVVVCEGNIHDPNFVNRFPGIVRKLKCILCKGRKSLQVRKVEPWNSVKVTMMIPPEAAIQLRRLAQQGSSALRELGILSVQVQGDQKIRGYSDMICVKVISLTLTEASSEKQKLLRIEGLTEEEKNEAPSSRETFQILSQFPSTSGMTAASASSTSHVISIPSSSTGPPKTPTSNFDLLLNMPDCKTEEFRSPNVVVPQSSKSVPFAVPQPPPTGSRSLNASCAPTITLRPSSTSYPFASMEHATHSSSSARGPSAGIQTDSVKSEELCGSKAFQVTSIKSPAQSQNQAQLPYRSQGGVIIPGSKIQSSLFTLESRLVPEVLKVPSSSPAPLTSVGTSTDSSKTEFPTSSASASISSPLLVNLLQSPEHTGPSLGNMAASGDDPPSVEVKVQKTARIRRFKEKPPITRTVSMGTQSVAANTPAWSEVPRPRPEIQGMVVKSLSAPQCVTDIRYPGLQQQQIRKAAIPIRVPSPASHQYIVGTSPGKSYIVAPGPATINSATAKKAVIRGPNTTGDTRPPCQNTSGIRSTVVRMAHPPQNSSGPRQVVDVKLVEPVAAPSYAVRHSYVYGASKCPTLTKCDVRSTPMGALVNSGVIVREFPPNRPPPPYPGLPAASSTSSTPPTFAVTQTSESISGAVLTRSETPRKSDPSPPSPSRLTSSGKPRQYLINPLSGLLEPLPTDSESSDDGMESDPEDVRASLRMVDEENGSNANTGAFRLGDMDSSALRDLGRGGARRRPGATLMRGRGESMRRPAVYRRERRANPPASPIASVPVSVPSSTPSTEQAQIKMKLSRTGAVTTSPVTTQTTALTSSRGGHAAVVSRQMFKVDSGFLRTTGTLEVGVDGVKQGMVASGSYTSVSTQNCSSGTTAPTLTRSVTTSTSPAPVPVSKSEPRVPPLHISLKKGTSATAATTTATITTGNQSNKESEHGKESDSLPTPSRVYACNATGQDSSAYPTTSGGYVRMPYSEAARMRGDIRRGRPGRARAKTEFRSMGVGPGVRRGVPRPIGSSTTGRAVMMSDPVLGRLKVMGIRAPSQVDASTSAKEDSKGESTVWTSVPQHVVYGTKRPDGGGTTDCSVIRLEVAPGKIYDFLSAVSTAATSSIASQSDVIFAVSSASTSSSVVSSNGPVIVNTRDIGPNAVTTIMTMSASGESPATYYSTLPKQCQTATLEKAPAKPAEAVLTSNSRQEQPRVSQSLMIHEARAAAMQDVVGSATITKASAAAEPPQLKPPPAVIQGSRESAFCKTSTWDQRVSPQLPPARGEIQITRESDRVAEVVRLVSVDASTSTTRPPEYHPRPHEITPKIIVCPSNDPVRNEPSCVSSGSQTAARLEPSVEPHSSENLRSEQVSLSSVRALGREILGSPCHMNDDSGIESMDTQSEKGENVVESPKRQIERQDHCSESMASVQTEPVATSSCYFSEEGSYDAASMRACTKLALQNVSAQKVPGDPVKGISVGSPLNLPAGTKMIPVRLVPVAEPEEAPKSSPSSGKFIGSSSPSPPVSSGSLNLPDQERCDETSTKNPEPSKVSSTSDKPAASPVLVERTPLPVNGGVLVPDFDRFVTPVVTRTYLNSPSKKLAPQQSEYISPVKDQVSMGLLTSEPVILSPSVKDITIITSPLKNVAMKDAARVASPDKTSIIKDVTFVTSPLKHAMALSPVVKEIVLVPPPPKETSIKESILLSPVPKRESDAVTTAIGDFVLVAASPKDAISFSSAVSEAVKRSAEVVDDEPVMNSVVVLPSMNEVAFVKGMSVQENVSLVREVPADVLTDLLEVENRVSENGELTRVRVSGDHNYVSKDAELVGGEEGHSAPTFHVKKRTPALEQLTIEIPTSIGAPDEEKRMATRASTRSASRLNSPQSRASPRDDACTPSPCSTSSSKSTSKQPQVNTSRGKRPSAAGRGRNTSGDSNASLNSTSSLDDKKSGRRHWSPLREEELKTSPTALSSDQAARPGKRRCSENAAELIKACMGVDEHVKKPCVGTNPIVSPIVEDPKKIVKEEETPKKPVIVKKKQPGMEMDVKSLQKMGNRVSKRVTEDKNQPILKTISRSGRVSRPRTPDDDGLRPANRNNHAAEGVKRLARPVRNSATQHRKPNSGSIADVNCGGNGSNTTPVIVEVPPVDSATDSNANKRKRKGRNSGIVCSSVLYLRDRAEL